MHAATAEETSKGAQRHDHSPRVSQDRRSGGDGSSGCARNRPRPGRAQMEDAVDVAGRIGQPEDLRRLGQEDKGSQRRSHRDRAAGGRLHHRLHGNARRDARRGARLASKRSALRVGPRARPGAARRPQRRFRDPLSDADVVRVRRRHRNRPRHLQALQQLLCRAGLVGRRIGAGKKAAAHARRFQGRQDARAGRARRGNLAPRRRRRRDAARAAKSTRRSSAA